MENMSGYRLLGPDERIRDGDEYHSDEDGWKKCYYCAGKSAFNSGRYIRRKIAEVEG